MIDEHNNACFIVKDATWQALGYFYFEEEFGRRSTDVRFSNRPFGVKHFQTIHRYSVDVAHGLVLLFGTAPRPLYGAFLVKKFLCRAAHHFPSSVSVFDLKVRSFVPMVKPHRDVFEPMAPLGRSG